MMTSVPLTLRLGRVLWSGGHATIDVPQVTERSVITVSYVPEDAEEYVRCGIACVRQYEGGLVFSAESTPTRDVSVQVIVMDDLRFGDVYDPLPYVELETLVMNGSASASVVSERLVLI